MRNLIIILSLMTVTILTSCGLDAKKKTIQEQYAPQWHEPNSSYLVNCGRVFIMNDIKVCGQYYVRPYKDPGECLVACTPDGKTWHYFQVWYETNQLLKVDDGSIIPPVIE